MESNAKRSFALRMMWIACWAAIIVVWAVFISLLVWRNQTSVLDIEVPISDRRIYKEILLDNGLKVLLVQDNSADRAAVAVSVSAGSNQEWLPGLAHLTEHMVFYASKEYPKEDGLRLYLASHGGDTNAYTEAEETNYYYFVDHDYLLQSLKIFAGAFTSPIFTEDAVNREILAVNSEHEKNVYDDNWRLNRLVELMAGQAHPFSHFSTGSVDSLKSENLSKEVQKFFNRFYKAPNMRLVVLGKESVNQLSDWVKEEFAKVATGIPHTYSYETAYPLKSKFVITPKVAPGHQLSIVWPLESQYNYVNEQPADFISYLLINPGPGGLKGKLPNLIAGVYADVLYNYSDFSALILQIDLTPAGVKQWDSIASKVHGYLNTIAETDPLELKVLWEDYARLSWIDFYYSEQVAPEDLVSHLASNMQKFASSNYLAGFSIKNKFDYNLIMKTLKGMKPDDSLYFMMCDMVVNGEKLGNVQVSLDQYESNYDLQYQVMKATLPDEDSDFSLPDKNPHIPKEFGLVDCSDCSEDPELVTDTDKISAWHLYAGEFGLPKISLKTKILLQDSADNLVLNELIALHANLVTSELLYLWLLAGYSISAEAKQTGLELTLSGWSDNFDDFFEDALKALTKPSELFTIVKDLQAQSYKSIDTEQPYQVAFELLHRLIVKDYVSQWERLNRVAAVTEDEFTEALANLMDNSSLQMLSIGNLNPDEAQKLSEIASDLYDYGAIDFKGVQSAIIDKPVVFTEAGGLNNNAIINYYQFGQYEPSKWAPVLLLSKILSDEGFTVLRTEQQLGYIVFAEGSRDLGDMGIFVLVQGSYKNPREMNEAIKTFLNNLEIEPGDFEELKYAVSNSLLIPDISLEDMSYRIWNEISSNRFEFDNTRLAAEVLDTHQSDVEALLASAASSKGLLSVQVFKTASEASPGIDIDYFKMRNEYYAPLAN
mmetsp:Transcript_7239/g.13383  ORF Transcript_7239/g.13383 Transcript_7239/m.13383 type:complete len:941 (-) Transcript_7239:109-2931(-)